MTRSLAWQVPVGFIGCVLLVAAGCSLSPTGLAALSLELGNNEEQLKLEKQKVKPLVLYSTTSMVDCAELLAREYERAGRGEVVVVTGASGALAQQIFAGGPADVFLSSSAVWSEELQEHGLAERSEAVAQNRLVLIALRENVAGLQSPSDLTKPALRKLAIAEGMSSAGLYAEQCLRAWNVFDTLVQEDRILRGVDSRATLSFVENGHAEAGIVYATDVFTSNRFVVIHEIPTTDHDPLTYELTLVKRKKRHADAEKLFTYLQSPDALGMYARYGFLPAK